jgi:hypothetical protein
MPGNLSPSIAPAQVGTCAQLSISICVKQFAISIEIAKYSVFRALSFLRTTIFCLFLLRVQHIISRGSKLAHRYANATVFLALVRYSFAWHLRIFNEPRCLHLI